MHPLWAGVLNGDHARRQNPLPQPPPPGVPGAGGEGEQGRSWQREYPASPEPPCGYCDFLEISRKSKGFVKSHPVAPEGEAPWE